MDTGLTKNVAARLKGLGIKPALLLLLLLSCSLISFGEGTRELLVNTALAFDTTKSTYTGTEPTTPANCVQIWDNGAGGGVLGRISGTWTSIAAANEKYRLKIRVCAEGEVINLGFHPLQGETTYFRLYREDGTCMRFDGQPVVSGGGITNLSTTETVSPAAYGSNGTNYTYLVPPSTSTIATPGFIKWYSQSAVGPLPACSTTTAVGQLGVGYPIRTYCGYTPIQYKVTAADMATAGAKGYVDFFIAFNSNQAVNEQRVKHQLAMLDVTVWSDITTRTVRKGRFFCAAWEIQCGGLNDPRNAFNSKLYFYSTDSVVTAVTFNQMRPFGFVISANQYGCSNTGNTDFDRRSRINFNSNPDYPIFLNNPYDTVVAANRTCGIVPKSSFGSLLDASITGCDNDRCINVRVDKTGMVGISLLPASGNSFVPRIFDNQTVQANQNVCIPWDGKDGAGNPIIGVTKLQLNYFNGLTHLPLYDVEEHQFGYSINLIMPKPSVAPPASGITVRPILVYWDDRGPASTGVTDFTAGRALDGYWDHDNNPLTPPKRVGFTSGEDTSATGASTAADTVNQAHSTYNLVGCVPSLDHNNAGGNQGVGCHLWTSRGNNGTCPYTSGTTNCAETHNTWWNANVIEKDLTYHPSNVHVYSDPGAAPAPIGTGNASAKVKNFCVPTPVPINGIVRVDPSITNIADANDISDDNPGTGRWSILEGSGSFGSAVTNLVNTYVPDAGGLDLARGYVRLIVTSDSNSTTPCGRGRDTLRINLFTAPDVWTRPGPVTVCANNALVQLDPGISGDSSGKNSVVSTFIWTPYNGSTPLVGGIFVPNNQSLGTNVTYTPPASFTSGTITMRIKSVNLTTPSYVTCAADSAQFNIIVNAVPAVVALDTLKICNTSATVSIPAGQATINGGTSTAGFTVNWTGNGSFTGNGTLTPVYTPTAAERALGIAKIVFNVTKTSAPACAQVRDTLIIRFFSPPTADAGSPFSLCANNAATIPLNGLATNFGTVSWSASPATGSFSPTNNDTTTFTRSGALPGSFTFTLTATATSGNPCPAATSNVIVSFTPSPTVDAGANKFYCKESPSVQLTATLGGSATSGEWFSNSAGTSKPAGTFTPNDKDPNATYTLTTAEQIPPAVALYYITTNNGNCLAVKDSMVIFKAPNPTINVPDRTVCNNIPTVTFTGPFITGAFTASSVLWTSLGSAQNFAPNNTQNTVFTPSNIDIANGSVKLILQATTSAATGCSPVRDTMTITFTEAPTVTAGGGHNVCTNNPTVAISGSVSPAGTPVTWSVSGGVGGTFGSTSSLNTTFTASGTPGAGTTTTLMLTANLAGCNPVPATATITYTPRDTARVTTAPGSVCKNNPVITLSGTSSTGSLHWSSSSGCASCFSDTNAIAPSTTLYTPSATDLSNGFVDFTVQTRNTGNCLPETSTSVRFTFIDSPTATPGTYSAVCENNANISLAGSVSAQATGGTWSSSSGCVSCFGDPNSLSTTYTPSVADINNGSVQFTLTTTGNTGNCLAGQASTTVNISKAPSISAGPDLTVCSNQNTVALTGATSSNTTSVSWAVKAGAGTGTITNASSLTGAVYNITATDKSNGTAIVVLTGNGNSPCAAVTQERIIQFTDLPTVAVGPDRTVCMNDAPAVLDATGSNGGTWTCAGCAGSITSPGSLVASYNPTAGDIGSSRTFTHSIPASAGCPAVSASLNITFNAAPTVSISSPTTSCGNSMNVSLSATAPTGATGVIWTASGNGSFDNATSLTPIYTLAPNDTVGINSTVTFTVMTTGSSPCSPVSASSTVTITEPIRLNAGSDQNRCATTGSTVTLTPTVLAGGATGVTWSIIGASTGSLAGSTYTIGAGDAGTNVTFQATTIGAPAPCTNISDQVIYTFVAPVTSTITAPPASFCQTGSVTLTGSITNTNTGTWTCTNCTGTGTFSTDNTYNNAAIPPKTSVVFTPSPLDTAAASLSFRLTSDNTNVCGSVASAIVSVNLEKKPRVSIPSTAVRCANNNVITLPKTSVTHTGTGVWHAGINKTTGFSATNNFPAADTYDPDTTEVQNGFVTLTLISTAPVGSVCPSDSAKMVVTFTDAPVVFAGLDRTICKNNPTFNLAGSVNPTSGFTTTWSSLSCGTACFSSPNSLATNYTLNYPADTNGVSSIQLFLTATDPSGLCSPDRDTVVINLTQPPIVDISTTFPAPICNDNPFINLSGTSTGGYNWSSTGTGTFQVNAFQPNVVYPFTQADRDKALLAAPNNTIRITLSSDNGACLPVSDFVDVTLTPAPTVTITTGDSTTICANINTVNVNASVDQAGFNIDWTTSGNGTFSPDAPTVPAFATTYSLTNLDKAAGSIILVAHTTNPPGSTCMSASKQFKVNITPLPTITMGPDITVCQTVTSVDISDVSVTNTNSTNWTTSGTGVFGVSSATVGTGSVYYPTYLGTAGTNDVDQAFVDLTLSAVGCSTITSTRRINFTQKPTIEAGINQTVCNEVNTVSVTGTATNFSSVSWRAQGAASNFSNALNGTYSITAANKTAGFVNLIFTVNGNGTCGSLTDTVRITIRPQPTIEIGPGASFCAKTITEDLQYNFPAITITNGITPVWSTTGTAANLDQFNPLQPTYYLTTADINNGSVTISAVTRSHASCMAVSDATTLTITKAPTLNIGPDISQCPDLGVPIQLTSSSTNSSGTPTWFTDKAGIFDDPNIINPTYAPDAAEDDDPLTTMIIASIAGTGSCPATQDTLYINFRSSAAIADLRDSVICYTSGVPFNYTITTGTEGDWTTSAGSFMAPGGTNQQSVTLQYTPSSGDPNINITFDPTNTCFSGTADAVLTLVEAPSVTAAGPLDVCINNFLSTPINISAAAANNSSLQWNILQGFGTIAAPASASTNYTLDSDSSDFGLGSILLKITAQATNPSCPAAEDTFEIRTHQAPTAFVADQLVCTDIVNDLGAITLDGNVIGTGHTGINWTVSGLTLVGSSTSLVTTATLTSLPATATLNITGMDASCAAVAPMLTITGQAPPTVTTTLNNLQSCSNGQSVDLDAAGVIPSVTGGFWSKQQAIAGGSFVPNNIGAAGRSYVPSTGDIAAGTINLIYTVTDTGVCYKGYGDTISVVFNTPVKIQTTTPTFTFCAQDNSVNLTSTITPVVPISPPAGPVVTWSIESNNGGVFTGATNTLNTTYDPNPSNIPNGGDVANGGAILKVKLTNVTGCPDDSDLVSLLLVPEPAAFVNAGATQQICSDRTSAQLQGLILNADGGVWRTTKYGNISYPAVAATGTFSDSTDLEGDYFLSAADRSKASIRLYLYSVGGNSLCSQVIDSVDIILTPIPVPSAVAGANSVCADVDSINVTGAFTVGGINGVWSSSGDGYFTNIDNFDPTPIYIPGPTDIAQGRVIFTYSSNNYQDCKVYSAKDTTIITPRIDANAGPDVTVCGNNTTGITITASSPPTNAGIWTINGVAGTDYDGVFTQLNNLQASYIPGDTIDPIVGAVSLKFVSTGGSPCKPDSSQMVVKIAPAPTVAIATNTQTVCNDVSSINVNVTNITVATGGFWTSTGTGTFANSTALNTTYSFSASDLDSTNITIAFVTTGNMSSGSQCNPAADAMVITLKPKPVVVAAPQYNCVTPIGVTLDNSSVTYVDPGATGIWSTSSSGTAGQFSLDQFITTGATTTSYFPSASDIINGTVTLTLTSAGAGTCKPVSRSVILNVSNTPLADAGPDLFVCSGADVSLNATPRSNLVQYDWLSILPAAPVLSVSGLQAQAGPINSNTSFELTVTDNRGCTNKDTVVVNAVANPMITQVNQQCYDFFGYVNVAIGGTVSPLGGYQWFYNGALMSGETRDSVRITQPGLYQVYYSIGACTNSSDQATNVLDLPRILTPDYIGCKNSTVVATLSEIPNTQLSGLGMMPYTYTWTPSGSGNPATLATSTINPTVVDTLTYYVTASYNTGSVTCTYDDSVRVISIPTPDPSLVDSTQVCAGGTVTLDANTPPSNLPQLSQFTQVIEWYASGSPTPILDNDAVYNPTASGDYVVQVTIGQCTGDDTARVDFRPYPTKTLPSEVKQCFEQVGSVTLDAGPGSVGSPGLTGVTYQWSSGAGDPALSTSTSQTTVITYPMIKDQDDEQIEAYVTITNQFNTLNCPVDDTILVRDVCVPRVFPPTVFHPGDGNPIDGEFTIKGKYISKFKLTVYSRWGEVIFYSEDPNKHWDGTYRGELMPIGVYAYIITYEGKDELTKGPFRKEGRIVLVR